MEVSSHALATHRADGVHFALGALTNISVDHLDFHGDMASYEAAKMRLFEDCLRANSPAVLPFEHTWTGAIAQKHKLLTWSASSFEADVVALDHSVTEIGNAFKLRLREHERFIQTRLFGSFNIDNVLCAAACAYQMGIPFEAIVKGLEAATGVPGRFEKVPSSKKGAPLVFVDFAHTPDAVSKALQSARSLKPKNLISVLGCGGNRDKGKRPLMGKVAAELANSIIITDDNPRQEVPETIRQEILSGVPADRRAFVKVIGDRKTAIEEAICLAGREDIVMILGKGHEKTQTVGDLSVPFDDVLIARNALEARVP
jgi:UDP-N-acetylmuramoyl-L-alanyl-D-glutamate--2,6-diaminopimelate ligase